MGLYAEPPEDKVLWIKRHGEPILVTEETVFLPSSSRLPVVLLRQGFIALGVAYSQRELKRFLQGRPDGRWYLVPKAELRRVVPGGAKMRELR